MQKKPLSFSIPLVDNLKTYKFFLLPLFHGKALLCCFESIKNCVNWAGGLFFVFCTTSQKKMEVNEEDVPCPWGIDTYCMGSFVLCLDGLYGAGDFVWASMLIALAKAEQTIVLISTNHGPEHWESLLRKNGDLRRKGLLDSIYIKYVVPNGTISEAEKRCISDSTFHCDHCSWQELMQWQQQGMPLHVGKGETSGGICLLLDDIHALEVLSPSPREARLFFNRCLYSLFDKSSNSAQGAQGLGSAPRVAVVVACGPAEPTVALEPSDEPTLTEVCKSRANITVAALPLSTGYSQDVHGVVHVTAVPIALPGGSSSSSTGGPAAARLLEEVRSFKVVRPGTIISHRMSRQRED